jgi:hypothetical protein
LLISNTIYKRNIRFLKPFQSNINYLRWASWCGFRGAYVVVCWRFTALQQHPLFCAWWSDTLDGVDVGDSFCGWIECIGGEGILVEITGVEPHIKFIRRSALFWAVWIVIGRDVAVVEGDEEFSLICSWLSWRLNLL